MSSKSDPWADTDPWADDNSSKPAARTYAEILASKDLKEWEKPRIQAEATVALTAAVLVQRGKQDVARLLLDVISVAREREWNNDGDNLWLEVAPEHMGQFSSEVMEVVSSIAIEVADRQLFGIQWIGVREVLPEVGPEWRDQIREQVTSKRPTNQARRPRNGPPRYVEDYLVFTNAGEQAVYRTLKEIQLKLPRDYTIGIYPLPGGRMPERTWEPDVLVTYKGRAGIIEIDGPVHNGRRAQDLTRDHILQDTGIAYVDRIPVEVLGDPEELTAALQRFIRRLGEAR